MLEKREQQENPAEHERYPHSDQGPFPPNYGEGDACDEGGEEGANGEHCRDPAALVAAEAVVALCGAEARVRHRITDDDRERRRRPAKAVAEAEGAHARAHRCQELRQLGRIATTCGKTKYEITVKIQ